MGLVYRNLTCNNTYLSGMYYELDDKGLIGMHKYSWELLRESFINNAIKVDRDILKKNLLAALEYSDNEYVINCFYTQDLYTPDGFWDEDYSEQHKHEIEFLLGEFDEE